MLKLNNYLEKNYKKLKEISDKITSGKKYNSEDLLHDTIVNLYDSDKNKIESLIDKNELIFWIARIMVNQYHSKTSPFYKKYKKYYQINVGMSPTDPQGDLINFYDEDNSQECPI